jgi:hypothetical protein
MTHTENQSLRVILVHGTGSAATEDIGTSWWQIGGGFQEWLKGSGESDWSVQPILKTGSYVEEDNGIFHWSGANSELERRRAGQRLASLLRTFEEKGQPYALIGHSHGGSVIWHALLDLYTSGLKLDCLHSVVTLGTPFLRFGARWAWMRQLVLLGACAIGFWILQPLWIEFLDQASDLWISGEYSGLVIAITSIVAWVVITLLSAVMTIKCTFNGLKERKRKSQEAELEIRLGERLLCISLPTDEAINGLATTVPIRRIADRKQARIYSRWLTRLTDWIFVDRLTRQTAGNDLRGVVLLEVGRTPAPDVRKFAEFPNGCRDPIQKRVELMAGRSWREFQDRLRQRAEQPYSWKAELAEALFIGAQFNTALIHCQYYDDVFVRRRIISHLKKQSRPEDVMRVAELPLPSPPPETIRWALAGLILVGMVVLGAVVSKTGEALLSHGIIRTIVRRAPFMDAHDNSEARLGYLRALVATGQITTARELIGDLQPEEQSEASQIFESTKAADQARSSSDKHLHVYEGYGNTTKIDPSALVTAFPRWPIEDEKYLILSPWNPDARSAYDTVESMTKEKTRYSSEYEIHTTPEIARQLLGESYVAYIFRAFELPAPDVDRVTHQMLEIPPSWHDLCQRWLVRAYSSWGRADLAMPYLRTYKNEAVKQLLAPARVGAFPRAAVAMELLDLADCFDWLSDSRDANELRKMGEQELSKEGLSLQGVQGAILWANEGRLDRTELLVRSDDWGAWKMVFAGMRKLSFLIWHSRAIQNRVLLGQYAECLLAPSESERLDGLAELVTKTQSIANASARSWARRELALDYVELMRMRTALDVADGCVSEDRLTVYSEILLVLGNRPDRTRLGTAFRSRMLPDIDRVL